MHNLFVPLQRAGLHPGLQRQGGCRRLALGTKGKSVTIMCGVVGGGTGSDVWGTEAQILISSAFSFLQKPF